MIAIQPAMLQPVWAQEIVIDASGNVGGTRMQSNSRAPVVDIARPNASGVSHNRYERLDVGSRGAVLNNSASSSTTQNAGAVAGNPNLADRTASTIVNEVTSSRASRLQGTVEVAGSRAQVVIANPNGIDCDGCNFSNTSSATLTTGRPTINGGAIELDVSSGAISIGRRGLDGAAGNVSAVNLIGRMVVIDGKVTAVDEINVQGGAQRWDLGRMRRSGAASEPGAAGSDYAIDATAFGAMEAGRIHIVGNENGLGVRLQGAVQAHSSEARITSRGSVDVTSVEARGNVRIESSGQDVRVRHDVASLEGDVVASARGNLVFDGWSGAYAAGALDLRGNHVTLDGDLQSDSDIRIAGRELSFGAYASAAGRVSFAVTHEGRLQGATIIAHEIDAGALGRNVSIEHSALFTSSDVRLSANSLSFGGEIVVAGLSADETPRLIADIAGDFRNDVDLRSLSHASISWGGALYNETRGVFSADALMLSQDGAIYNRGTLHGEQSVAVSAGRLVNHDTGVIIAPNVSLSSATDLVNEGAIASDATLNMTAATVLRNDGLIDTVRARLEARDVTNGTTGQIRASGSLEAVAVALLHNQGRITAIGPVTLRADRINNTGLVMTDGRLTANAEHIASSGLLLASQVLQLTGAQSISNDGSIIGYGNAALLAATVTNRSVVVADGTLTIRGTTLHNSSDKALLQARAATFGVDSFRNDGRVTLQLNYRSFDVIHAFRNDGVFSSAGNIELRLAGDGASIDLGRESAMLAGLLVDEDGNTEFGTGRVLLAAPTVIIRGQSAAAGVKRAQLIAGGGVTVEAATAMQIGGIVQSHSGSVSINAPGIGLAQIAEIIAGRDLVLSSGEAGITNAGLLAASGALSVTDGMADFNNTGIVSIGRTGRFNIAGEFRNSGVFTASGNTVIAAGSVLSNGHLQGATGLSLNAASIRLHGTVASNGALTLRGAEVISGLTGRERGAAESARLSADRLIIAADNLTLRGAIYLSGARENTWTASNSAHIEAVTYSEAGLRVTAPRISTAANSVISSEGTVTLLGQAADAPSDITLRGYLSGANITLSNLRNLDVNGTAQLSSSGNIRAIAGGRVRQWGQMAARGNIVLNGDSLLQSGTLYAETLDLRSANAIEHRGSSFGAKRLTMASQLGLHNYGEISARDSAVLNSGTFIRNYADAKIEASSVTLRATAGLDNRGRIFGADRTVLSGQHFHNTETGQIVAGTLDLLSRSWATNHGEIKVFGLFGDVSEAFRNHGEINARDVVVLTTRTGTLNNEASGDIQGRIISLSSGGQVNNHGTIGVRRATGGTERVRVFAQSGVTNTARILGNNVSVSGEGITNEADALIRASNIVEMAARSGALVNHGQVIGDEIGLTAQARIDNYGTVNSAKMLGMVADNGRVRNEGRLFGDEIRIFASNGAVISTTAIHARKVLSATGANANFAANVTAGEAVQLETTAGDLVLGTRVAAPTVSLRVSDALRAGAGSVRGAQVSQIIAGNIVRTDIAATNRRLGVLPVAVGDVYVELTAANFGPAAQVTLAGAADIPLSSYEAVNLRSTGSVALRTSAGDLFLTGRIEAAKHINIRASRFAALRNVELTAGQDIYLEGNTYLKNHGNTRLSAQNVALVQNTGWFRTSDWLDRDVGFNLYASARSIIVDSDHRFISRDITLNSQEDIWQGERVISARAITYRAGRDIFIRFDPFIWRGRLYQEFGPSVANSDPRLKPIAQADTSDWWGVEAAGLRGHPLLAQHQGIGLYAGRDLKLVSGRIHSTGDITLVAGRDILSEPVYIESAQLTRPPAVGWAFDGRYGLPQAGHNIGSVKINALRAYENQIHARGNVSMMAGGNIALIGSRLLAVNGDISLEAGGGIVMAAAPGFWSYDYQHTTTKRRLFYKSRTTLTVSRYEDIYTNTMLSAENGTVSLVATGLLSFDQVNRDGVAIMSAGTSISARDVDVRTNHRFGSILLGTYDEESVTEESRQTKRSLFSIIPMGRSSSEDEKRVLMSYGNDFVADEILSLNSSNNLQIIAGSLRGREVRVTAAGNLDIRAAINSVSHSYRSTRDNMVTITEIQRGRVVESASLPQIRSIRPASFTVGGPVTIAGYRGPSLNSMITATYGNAPLDRRMVDIFTPEDRVGAAAQVRDLTHHYDYKLPSGGDYAYLSTLLNEHGATYETISLRNQEWYDRQVRLNPAFQAALGLAIGYVTGGLGLGHIQSAMVNRLANDAIAGAITGQFDPKESIRSALMAGVTADISNALSSRFRLGEMLGLDRDQPIIAGLPSARFGQREIMDRLGAQLVSNTVDNVAGGRAPFAGLDQLGRSFVIGEAMAIVHHGIGEIGYGREGWEGSLPHLMLHGSFGCFAMEKMGGNCAAGFFAAVSHEWAKNGEGSQDSDKGSRFAHLLGGLVGFVFADGNAINVGFGAQIAQSAFENNYLGHDDLAIYKRRLERECGDKRDRAAADCIANIWYNEGGDGPSFAEISAANQADLDECAARYDDVCLNRHLNEILAARQMSGEMTNYWANRMNVGDWPITRNRDAYDRITHHYIRENTRMAERRARICPQLDAAACTAIILAADAERNGYIADGLQLAAEVLVPGVGTAVDAYTCVDERDAFACAFALASVVPGGSLLRLGGKYFRKSDDEIIEALPSPNQSRTRACSFHGDTLVLTDAGLLPIRDVTTTMSVWSRDNATDRVGWQPVQAHYANDYDTTVTVEITDLSTGAQQDIISNRIHPFFVSSAQAARRASAQHSYSGEIADGHWVQAENLQPGDRLLNDDGTWSEVTSVTLAAEPLTAYNLTVNEFHTYFVAANTNAAPVWVHNSCLDGPEPPNNIVTQIAPKIERQIGRRGWDRTSIDETIAQPHRTVTTRDIRHNPQTGARNDDPATAYINVDGSYVVRSDRSGDIVQISDRTNPNWASPFD
ncbi:MAG: polymorphic toxin-type HINT domain-containing protein [Paracoccus sp. (in: a-proteobacteria)]|nr:polymorphic toxin-type HINT domain-containing protein [Paracoccus sp. (in: a-proteobacteria)]